MVTPRSARPGMAARSWLALRAGATLSWRSPVRAMAMVPPSEKTVTTPRESSGRPTTHRLLVRARRRNGWRDNRYGVGPAEVTPVRQNHVVGTRKLGAQPP